MAAAVFIGAFSWRRSLPQTMAAAPLFVQFSVIGRPLFLRVSADPALEPSKEGGARFAGVLAASSLSITP
jgi:hypothetical protein